MNQLIFNYLTMYLIIYFNIYLIWPSIILKLFYCLKLSAYKLYLIWKMTIVCLMQVIWLFIINLFVNNKLS